MSNKSSKKIRKILADSGLTNVQMNAIKKTYAKLPHDQKNGFLNSLSLAKQIGKQNKELYDSKNK